MKNKNVQQKVKVDSVSKKNRYQEDTESTQKKEPKTLIGSTITAQKQRKVIVNQKMKENANLSSRKQVKHTRGEYKEAQKKYRAKVQTHKQLKQSLDALNAEHSSKVTDQQRAAYTDESKKLDSLSSGKTAEEIRAKTFAREKLEKEVEKAGNDVKNAKEEAGTAKQVLKKTKKADPSRLSKQVNRQALSAAKNKAEESMNQHDTLAEAVKLRQDGRRRTNTYQSTKYLVKSGHRVNMKLTRGAYGLSNRSYNFIRGRGFQTIPEEYSKLRQTAKRMRNFRNRLQASKAAQAARKTQGFVSSIIRVLNNPFKGRNLLIIGGIMMFIATIFMFFPLFTPLPIQQDEFDLTDSWNHMTKLDADRSDDTYSFYTNPDETMFYMNYRFEDYTIDERTNILSFKTYGDYLNGIWESMNNTKGDEYKFTSMYDLAKDKKSDYYLDSDDFEEMKENVDEYGYSTLDGQLSQPFETDSLPITRRFGYEVSNDKAVHFGSIEVETNQDLDLKAPMSGNVKWYEDQKKVIITEEGERGSRLILTGVYGKRQESGSVVQEGELVAKATGSKLTISYEKYDEDKKTMRRVNPAFYFPSVSYRQKTTVSEPFDPEGGELENARFLYSKLTEQGYKLEGICAMLGNYSVESSINPKRAEGDYLSPPVGASKDSWDDPAWLAIGGMQIYGRYPNIVHRGLGLGQWTDTADGGTRHTLLVNFAKEKKKKWYSLGLQMDFMLNGDVPAYRTIFKQILSGESGSSVAELTRDFLVRWEGNPGDKLQARVEAGEKWYKYFKENPDSDPGGSTGKYILPISPPNISSGFGWRSMGDYHRGLDFAHPQGTPIKAIDGGTVITAEFHYSWGNHVRVRHDNGQTSLYAHCSALKVKVGDKVKQGDIVGLVGNTGNSFGAHLHLEISKSTDLSVASLLDPAVVLGINK
ncbi:phage tail tip lysozyme [Enterococcus gilvus]|uniref:phage tail tip lysozyme n=2 Tax=Enterococcus TaxID=1350 RepID=UPI003D6A7ADF